MPIRGIVRSKTVQGSAYDAHAPIYVDSDDNILKMIPAGSGTTEVQVVDASSVQTLTNKTLTSPVITGATVTAPTGTVATEVVSATNVITAAESGKTFFLNSATEFASTLPAPAAGLFYRFIVTAAPSGASYTVVTEGGCQVLGGHVLTSDVYTDSAVDADTEQDITGTTITFVDGVAVVGDMAEVWSDGTGWYARCSCAKVAGITITG
jgi:hypothetical protein